MTEFKDPVPHTGGTLTISIRGRMYQLGYTHYNHNRAGLVQLIAVNGEVVDSAPIHGMGAGAEHPDLMTMLPTDSEGMYGRRCPKCDSYFRASHPFSEFCPYCSHKGPWQGYMTDAQREFIRRQYETIRALLGGPDGETTIDFDTQNTDLTRPDRWVYSEERQQNHFQCNASPKCRVEVDVLGEYVRCPECGKRRAREVIDRTLAGLSTDFEADAQRIATDQQEQRQRRWRYYVPAVTAEFEALGRDVLAELARLPTKPSRRRKLLDLSFQDPRTAAAMLEAWYAFDILRGLDESERDFLHKMFGRRHLFAHCGGRVDQEYLDRTADTSVRLNEVVRVRSSDVRRLLTLVRRLANNVLDELDSLLA
jgi:hypothetical protein